MAYKAQIGLISSGTLLTEDLMKAFCLEIIYLTDLANRSSGLRGVLKNAEKWLDARAKSRDEEYGSEIVSDLQDALNELAPPYCYFGASEGDGACFGFWPDMSQIDELPQVEGSDEAKALGEDCKSVNDHGNVTVYGGDGSAIIDFV